MNIVSNIFPPLALSDSVAPNARSSQDFSAILLKSVSASAAALISRPVSPLSADRQSQEVFSFGSLGVFGRYGDQGYSLQNTAAALTSMFATSSLPSEVAREVDIASNDPADHGAEISGAAGPIEVQNSPQSAAEEGRPHQNNPSVAALRNAITVEGNAVREAGQWQQSGLTTVEEALLPKSQLGKSRVFLVRSGRLSESDAGSVTVSGDDSVIGIVARNVDRSISSDTLRGAFSDVAAEFGAQVSEILINGESQNFAMFIGGNDGRRTR